MTEKSKAPYSVSDLTRLIRTCLEHEFGAVALEGELSNVRQPASGHLYFTLKDEQAQITAVMFRGDQRGLKFKPKDGMQIVVHGDVTVYERGGNYQIIVRRMEEAGQGALQARFEALKESLRKEGLFDQEHKKSLPLLPQHVGIVTSRTGAALRDILNVVTRRFPNLHVLLAPVKVQGEDAARQIAAAIDHLNRRGGLDVLIIGRGGGSLEDLWCFNEEVVARAISRSAIPVISAVGHEIDFTISDFVADLRAPTPSAAAELVVGCKEAFEETLQGAHGRIVRSLQAAAATAHSRLALAAGSYVFREPANLVRQYRQGMDVQLGRMQHALVQRSEQRARTLNDARLRLIHSLTLSRNSAAHTLHRLRAQLQALSPLSVMSRGYSVTMTATGELVRSAKAASKGDLLVTRLADGTITSRVDNMQLQPEDD